MGLMDTLRSRFVDMAHNLNGDPVFLAAAAASVATVTYADGTAESDELDAAAKSLISNGTIARSGYDHIKVQRAIDSAMENARTRAGKMTNLRALQQIASRPKEQREDVLLMGADVADVDKKEGHAAHGIGDDELRALEAVAKELGLKLADYGIAHA